MKVIVDRKLCSSYGVCVEAVAQVFSFDTAGALVIANTVPAELEEKVRFACESCPTQALRVEESSR